MRYCHEYRVRTQTMQTQEQADLRPGTSKIMGLGSCRGAEGVLHICHPVWAACVVLVLCAVRALKDVLAEHAAGLAAGGAQLSGLQAAADDHCECGGALAHVVKVDDAQPGLVAIWGGGKKEMEEGRHVGEADMCRNVRSTLPRPCGSNAHVFLLCGGPTS